MAFADLHCHLLPGIDDGAPDLAAAVAHARRLADAGVHDVACTSHVKRNEFPRVRIERLAGLRGDVQAAVDAAGIALRLHAGGELAHEDALELPPGELDLIAQGPAGARWLLLECPFEGIDDRFAAAAARLRGLGYGLLLAHPERSPGVTAPERAAILQRVLAGGALLQVNACSLAGHHGPAARRLAHRLVATGMAYCLASDGHPGTREHTLADGHAWLLEAGVDPAVAERLTSTNPLALLQDGVRSRALAA